MTIGVCWNIAKRARPWRELVDMGADFALLQEASLPPEDVTRSSGARHVAGTVDTGPAEHWDSHVWNSDWWHGRWPIHGPDGEADRHLGLYDRWPMVVRLSDRVEVEWFKQVSTIQIPEPDEIAVSGIGTIAAARITPRDGEPFVAVSMYARWMWPYQADRTPWTVGYPDASAHRIISDLSAFIGNTDPSTHRIVAAGDLNMVYGDPGDYPQSLAARERTVFDRMAALGLEFMGPPAPPRSTGRPSTRGPADQHRQRPYLLPARQVTGHGPAPTRLRVRLTWLPQHNRGAGSQRCRRLGIKRSLPATH